MSRISWKFRGEISAGNSFGRLGHAVAVDNENNRIFLFGGYKDGFYFNNLYEIKVLDSKVNSKVMNISNRPSKRKGHKMIYYNNHLILFGGAAYESKSLMDNKFYSLNLDTCKSEKNVRHFFGQLFLCNPSRHLSQHP